MGVTGCGKTTVARGLGELFGWEAADADDLHPRTNVSKMAQGIPLTDEDRWPWLDAVGRWLAQRDEAVIACSALKRAYRDRLRWAAPGVVFVHLVAPQEVLHERVTRRRAMEGHFAGPGLLDSQYAALEALDATEAGVTFDVSHVPASTVISEVRDALAGWRAEPI